MSAEVDGVAAAETDGRVNGVESPAAVVKAVSSEESLAAAVGRVKSDDLTSIASERLSEVSLSDTAAGDRSPTPTSPEQRRTAPVGQMQTTVIQCNAESEADTFARLCKGVVEQTASNREVLSAAFHAIVGGPFDMESKFVIQRPSSVNNLVALIDASPAHLQAELWSVFTAIARKSNRNLEACSQVGLISMILDRLPSADVIVADLLVEFLGVLSSYSITVKDMKRFLRALQLQDGHWQAHASKLIYVMRQMPRRDGPDVFFSFSGSAQAGIALPPLSRWPYQNGWTFATWLRMDPVNSVNFEKERPFVYCLRTARGLGYHCYFTGNCLVLTAVKQRAGRGVTRCIKHELSPRRWHHVAFAHVYSRWGRSEVQCFVDGQLVETAELAWPVTTGDHFDKCFIGCSAEGDVESSFCGQMGAVYAFADVLSLQQVNSLYCLGANYQSHFKYESESDLPDGYKKYLFDGKLCAALVFAYCPKNCDGQLCLESSPKTNASYFVHTPHAVMREDVRVVTTHSVHGSLHSVGGVQMLLPLFGQIGAPLRRADGSSAVEQGTCAALLSVVAVLLETSPGCQQQMFQNKAFLVISHALHSASTEHLSMAVLETFINIAKYLSATTTSVPLLKQLFDFILFNPALWIYTPANYLANDFLANAKFYQTIRRTSTVLQMLHALKFYYWVVDPRARSGYHPKGLGPRPDTQDVVKIRSNLLLFIRKLITRADTNQSKEDELQALLNYITTVHEDDNLYDVLQVTLSLMVDEPASMVPAFDSKKAVCVVFKLLASPNELVRLPALKMLAIFLSRATLKRKQQVMTPHNLFTLLTDRLLLNASYLSMSVYVALFELLTEQVNPQLSYGEHAAPAENARFENSTVLKVIANLICQSEPCAELLRVKQAFLADMLAMCRASKENRRQRRGDGEL